MLSHNLHVTEPYGYPDVHEFCIVEIYTHASLTEMKEKILCWFSKVSSRLRLVIAPTAFSMGINCPDIWKIIHYGPPSGPEQYVHETGRAGHDGLQSKAILLYGKLGWLVGQQMKQDGENKSDCRHKTMFQVILCYTDDSTAFFVYCDVSACFYVCDKM